MSPRLGPSKNVEILREDAFSRDLTYSLSDDRRTIRVRADEGRKYFPDVDTETDEVSEDVYTIAGDEPLSAAAHCSRSCTITYMARRGGDCAVRTETVTESWMRATETEFILENTLTTKINGEDFFVKTWHETVARDGV